ncbi:hypothetical protein DQJ15_27395, partial [Salmonella enterica subsp. enterica]|nr:hypothetical protein [Salmonella enterica subsp. enterica]
IHSDNPQLVGVTLYVDGRQAVQLPPGTLSRGILKLPPVAGTEWQIEVSGFTRVERITLSTSMTEMPA